MGEMSPPSATPENAFAADLFEDLLARYDRLTEVLSLGQNAKWRQELVRHIAHVGPRRIPTWRPAPLPWRSHSPERPTPRSSASTSASRCSSGAGPASTRPDSTRGSTYRTREP